MDTNEEIKDEVVESKNTDEKDEEVKDESIEEETLSVSKKDFDKLNQTIGSLKREIKDLRKNPEKPKEEEKSSTNSSSSDELDDAHLDYLDLKGITEDEDINVIKNVMKRTGQSLRQVLKDDYVVSKLNDLKKAREVKEATPSSTKRSGQQATDNEDYWFQKYEATGELPKGMPDGMATKLVRRKASQGDYRKNPYES